MHVSQSNIASAIAKGQSFVIETQLVQDARGEIKGVRPL